MRVEGSSTFAAPRDRTFQVFIDPGALAKATPGIQSLNQVAPDRFEAVMKVGVAGITGTYKGYLQIREKQPPEQYALDVAGEGSAGFVQGTGTFRFAEQDGKTVVTYLWDLQVGGMVASVGQRVLGGVCKLLIGQFMAAMAKELAG